MALAGGGKGALIGGLVGAGAGTAGAAYTGNKNVVIPAESTVTFTLTAPISVTVTPKEEAPAAATATAVVASQRVKTHPTAAQNVTGGIFFASSTDLPILNEAYAKPFRTICA